MPKPTRVTQCFHLHSTVRWIRRLWRWFRSVWRPVSREKATATCRTAPRRCSSSMRLPRTISLAVSTRVFILCHRKCQFYIFVTLHLFFKIKAPFFSFIGRLTFHIGVNLFFFSFRWRPGCIRKWEEMFNEAKRTNDGCSGSKCIKVLMSNPITVK